jgi:hypothetical protein
VSKHSPPLASWTSVCVIRISQASRSMSPRRSPASSPQRRFAKVATSGEIITAEHEHVLTVEEDPRVVRSIAAEAAERAAWYGVPASDAAVRLLLPEKLLDRGGV